MILAATDIPAGPVVIFMGFGALIAIVGHASKSKTLILTGIMMLFMATAAMFVGGYAAYQGDEEDVRPECGTTCPKPDEEDPPGP